MQGPKIVSVVSAKGGVGKTSMSMTLACVAEGVLGLNTLLVDTDDQILSGSADWLDKANIDSPFQPEHAALKSEEHLNGLHRLKYDLIVIDTPPRMTTSLLSRVLEMSDFVIAATTPRPADVTPALAVMHHVQDAGGLPKTLLGFGMVDTMRQGARASAEFRTEFARRGWNSLSCELRKFGSIESAIARAKLPGEYEGPSNNKANADAIAFTFEVLTAAGMVLDVDRIDAYWADQGVPALEAPYSRPFDTNVGEMV